MVFGYKWRSQLRHDIDFLLYDFNIVFGFYSWFLVRPTNEYNRVEVTIQINDFNRNLFIGLNINTEVNLL